MPSNTKTAVQAIGRWPYILRALGIDANYLCNKHGPCPICGGKDRFRFDDQEGRGTWICSRCGSGDGFSLLQRKFGLEFRQAAKEVDQVLNVAPAGPVALQRIEKNNWKALSNVWKAAHVVSKGDPVWCYLNARVGVHTISDDIRFHPALRYVDERGAVLGTFPVMLALMRYPDGAVASIHRTYLTLEGRKADVPAVKKVMRGKPLKTSAVRLGPCGRFIGIAEGIETALAASTRFSATVWAATNATLLEEWEPPVGVEQVLIAGDNDANYTGQAAAFSLACRLKRYGYRVKVMIPSSEGKDWADKGI
jgi:putative DNA primase/helicase